MAADSGALMRGFVDEVINGGDLRKIDEYLAPDFVERQEFPGLEPNREGVKKFFALFREAFPDNKLTVELVVVEGDLAALYGTWTGTHQAEFMGIPATGKSWSVPSSDFVRFRDGKGIEHWGVFDSGLMMQQLGVVPAMAGAGA